MVFASNNKGKLKEIRSILGEDIKSLADLNIDIDVIEDADTFYGNASKKAKEIYDVCKEAVIADDSGLCIDVLDGFPGVLTARFLGSDATSEDRNNYLVDKIKDYDNHNCSVICCLVYYDGEKELVATGELKGKIVNPRGDNGFGFDPIVELSSGKTLAELDSSSKNTISARYLAAKKLKSML